MEAARSSETLVSYNKIHGVTTQKTLTWILTAMKTSNLARVIKFPAEVIHVSWQCLWYKALRRFCETLPEVVRTYLLTPGTRTDDQRNYIMVLLNISWIPTKKARNVCFLTLCDPHHILCRCVKQMAVKQVPCTECEGLQGSTLDEFYLRNFWFDKTLLVNQLLQRKFLINTSHEYSNVGTVFEI
jgi:hypothetical protein